jgi:predicted RNase H-like HicB family nuclease
MFVPLVGVLRMTHGQSYETALQNVTSAIEHWIDTAKEFNDPIPEPKGQRLWFA